MRMSHDRKGKTRHFRSLLVEGLEKREVFAAFTTGNLVVERIGTIGSTTALSGSAFPVFVDEFTTGASQTSPVQTIALPTVTTGSQLALVDSGTSASNGFLTRSLDGQYLVLPGVNTATGTVSAATGAFDRVVGRIDVLGNVDTSTVLTGAFASNNFRSVTSTNGTDIWASGTGTGTTGGVWYTAFGSTAPTQLTTSGGNGRNVVATTNGLFVSTGSTTYNGGPVAIGILQIGTGVPTTTGQSVSQLVTSTGTSPSPYDIAISNDGLTMYVADDRSIANGGGIQKFTRANTSIAFGFSYAIGTGAGSTVGARSISVDFSGVNPVIVATTAEVSANRIIRLTDTGTQSGANGTVATLSTATVNTIYRGVDFAPITAVTPTVTIDNTLSGDTKVYDGSAYTASSSVTGGNASTPSPTFTYYVGTNTTGTNLGSTPPINAGTYTVVASVAIAPGSNAASSSPYTYSITTKALIVTNGVAPNRVYNGTNIATITGTLSGVVGTEDVTLVGTGLFAQTTVGTGIFVTSTSTLAGTAVGNYSLIQPTGLTANITQASLVASFTANNKPFDNTTAATVATLSLNGVIGSDAVTISGGSATFADIGVGNNKMVTATGMTIGGADAGNYTVNSTATALASITATVFNRQVFYNDSAFETVRGGSINAALDSAKVMLRSTASNQTTDFTNVTNYSRGLNGAVLDIAGLTVTALLASDFTIRVAPPAASGLQNPSTWAAAPVPSAIVVTAGTSSVPGRVRLEWPANAIQNTWLQIIVKANANTGLTTPQTFYIGHAMADVNGTPAYQVTGDDLTSIQEGISNTIVSANSIRDVNKDRRITGADLSFIQARISNNVLLNNITIPMAGSSEEGSAGGGARGGNSSRGGGGLNSVPFTSPIVIPPPASVTSIQLGGSLGTVASGLSTNQAIRPGSVSLTQKSAAETSIVLSQASKSSIDAANRTSSNKVHNILDELFAGLAKKGLRNFLQLRRY